MKIFGLCFLSSILYLDLFILKLRGFYIGLETLRTQLLFRVLRESFYFERFFQIFVISLFSHFLFSTVHILLYWIYSFSAHYSNLGFFIKFLVFLIFYLIFIFVFLYHTSPLILTSILIHSLVGEQAVPKLFQQALNYLSKPPTSFTFVIVSQSIRWIFLSPVSPQMKLRMSCSIL